MDGNKNNIVISVGRQFGCKGRVIGKALAERFGFSFYDAELLNLAAKEIGFDPSMFEMADEKPGLPEFFQNVGQLLCCRSRTLCYYGPLQRLCVA